MAASPVYQSADTQSNTSANGTLVINKPTNLNQGDLMVAHVGAANIAGPTWTPPAGWNAINNGLGNSSANPLVGVFWKVATNSEPSTYTFTESGNQRSVGAISRISGVDTVSPIDSSSAQANNGSSTTVAFGSITPTLNNNLIVLLVGAQNDAISAASCTNVSAFTLGYNVSAPSTGGELSIAYGTSSASGTVTPSATQAGSIQSNSVALSIAAPNIVAASFFGAATFSFFTIAGMSYAVVVGLFSAATFSFFTPVAVKVTAVWNALQKSVTSIFTNLPKS